jgi:hypothetical protein
MPSPVPSAPHKSRRPASGPSDLEVVEATKTPASSRAKYRPQNVLGNHGIDLRSRSLRRRALLPFPLGASPIVLALRAGRWRCRRIHNCHRASRAHRLSPMNASRRYVCMLRIVSLFERR